MREMRDEYAKEMGVNHANPVIRSMYSSTSRGEMAKQFERLCQLGWDACFQAVCEKLRSHEAVDHWSPKLTPTGWADWLESEMKSDE